MVSETPPKRVPLAEEISNNMTERKDVQASGYVSKDRPRARGDLGSSQSIAFRKGESALELRPSLKFDTLLVLATQFNLDDIFVIAGRFRALRPLQLGSAIPLSNDATEKATKKDDRVEYRTESFSDVWAMGCTWLLSSMARMGKPLALMLILAMIGPAAAIDIDIALQSYTGATMTTPDVGTRLPIGLIGSYALIVTGLLTTAANNVLGPLMGISSVLWFIMRNDAAIRPGASWAVFAMWAFVTLTYLSYQTRRIVLDKLYILLTLAFAGVCLCIIALVQKSSIQGGLVTAIPPCTSFAAYAVAFCFPTRRNVLVDTPV